MDYMDDAYYNYEGWRNYPLPRPFGLPPPIPTKLVSIFASKDKSIRKQQPRLPR